MAVSGTDVFKTWLLSLDSRSEEWKYAFAKELLKVAFVSADKIEPSTGTLVSMALSTFCSHGTKLNDEDLKSAMELTNVGVDFTTETALLRSAHHILRYRLKLEVTEGVPTWARSVMYSMEAGRMTMASVMDMAFSLKLNDSGG